MLGTPGSVDAQNAPTDPCKTTERFCTSSHTPHRRVPFQKNARPEPLRISGPLPTDSAEEAKIQTRVDFGVYAVEPHTFELRPARPDVRLRALSLIRTSKRSMRNEE